MTRGFVFVMFGLSRAPRTWSVLAAGTATLLLAAGVGTSPAVADPVAAVQQVSYLGLDFTVPASWPVIDVSATATTCVRFDQHAVYLGVPGRNQDCPSALVGRTEALLVQPATSTQPLNSTENTVAHQITATTATTSITATYGDDPATVRTALASAGLPAPQQSTKRAAVTPQTAPAALSTSVTNDTGSGFDACTAPSSATMSAWKSGSSYTAIGIYIGGSEAACAQPNLTAAWVAQQAAAGWHFLPIYVGPQASLSQLTSPAAQGTSAADDAISQAAARGFGPGNVLYYDMEAYQPAQRGAALVFTAAWNTELHRAGYWSGLYSSANSEIADLVANYGGSSTPDVTFTARWNGMADTDDANIPAGEWSNHQRAHQFASGHDETYNGATINIDSDYVDVGQAGSAATPVTGTFVPAGPTRLLDTRSGVGAPQARVGAGQHVMLQVGGVSDVPADVTAVVLNVTVTNPSAGSFLTVFPDGGAVPSSSNLNFTAGQTIPNLVTVPVIDGAVDFYNHTGTVDVIADLFGYYTDGSGNAFTPTSPTRLLDTRSGVGAPQGQIGPGQQVSLQVGGGVVPADATAVVLNVTVTNPSAGSFLTVFPDGGAVPSSSNLNFTAGQTIPNLVTVPVTNGVVDFYNHTGSVDVIADLFGYYTDGTGGRFSPVGPNRLLDTRSGTGAPRAKLGQNQTVALQVAGTPGVPANITAVVLNVTVTNPSAGSFLTVFPGGAVPSSSNLNFTAGQTIPNLVVVPVTNGRVDFYNHTGAVDVIADIFGYYTD
jgi:Domain of unknown function (DUF1906)